MKLPETSPLVIRKGPKLNVSLSPPLNPHSRSPTPGASLSIDTSRSRPTTPKPSIRLDISSLKIGTSSGSSVNGNSEPLFESYYGGPNTLNINTTADPPDEMTIRPSSSTAMPPPSRSEPFADVRAMLSELEVRTTASSSSSSSRPDDDDAVPAPTSPPMPYSDDAFEEISRLGEGAGGAVHKVKNKRTGEIMARKTITTREAPMKQLLRELLIISSNSHINIVRFHGAYMSPSSSEVKILMEHCEGGSLEAVGKRIKERGAVVGEKIAGRLAEGVGGAFLFVLHMNVADLVSGSSRSCLSAQKEDYSQGYQTIQHTAVSRRDRQTR